MFVGSTAGHSIKAGNVYDCIFSIFSSNKYINSFMILIEEKVVTVSLLEALGRPSYCKTA